MRTPFLFIGAALCGLLASTACGQWAQLTDETGKRLVLDPSFEYLNLEKDVTWGDFDQDGDTDLVVAMKFVGSIEGGWPNLVLMNENGVLVDRTDTYGTNSDIPGDMGLKEPTNDRDVRAVDFNNDGWLDLITTTTMSDGVDWTLGQPRAYLNLGEDSSGNWLGFRHEQDRLPRLYALSGASANPRFCDAAFGDFNGDGYIDIFFTDYDTPETAGQTTCLDINGDGDTNDPGECQESPSETPNDDFDSKLIMNWGDAAEGPGPGYFYDSLNTIMTSEELSTDFGNTAEAADMNADGQVDIVHVNTLGVNIVEILWNEGPNPGDDFALETIYTGAPYFVSAGDLDGDADMDLVIVDDSEDRYAINEGNGGDGRANFTTYVIGDSLSEFGNTSKLFDLDKDGDLDCFIADVDADLPSFCPTTGRRAHLYENTGDVNNLFVENTFPIPADDLAASFDVAPIDINGDGWLDLFHCKCSGFIVWMNQPPVYVSFAFPNGVPSSVSPGSQTTFEVELTSVGGKIDSGSEQLMVSADGTNFTPYPLTSLKDDLWEATLPAIACGESLSYFVQATIAGDEYREPSTSTFSVTPVTDFETTIETFTSGSGGFTATADASVSNGFWEVADPNPTFTSGLQMSPGDDATGDGSNQCWVTQNGPPEGSAGADDLDGGPVTLTSPVIDLSGADAQISMSIWFACNDAVTANGEEDEMTIEVSNNGTAWTIVESIDADRNNDGNVNTQDSDWFVHSFLVSNYVTPNDNVQVRIRAFDQPNNSVTEAGLDDFTVSKQICEENDCPADINGDNVVNGTDLTIILGEWGTNDPAGDLNGSGNVDGADLTILLSSWGPC